MKHLEFFENKARQEFWLFKYIINNNNMDMSLHLYPDRESAEIAVLTTINDERMELEGDSYNQSTMYFIDVDEALNWYEDTFTDTIITYDKISLSSPLTPGPELKRMREIKKYNL
jgi:hypothetical protein